MASSSTPIAMTHAPPKFDSQTFTIPAIIDDNVTSMTSSLKTKEWEIDMIEGKVTVYLLYFILIDI